MTELKNTIEDSSTGMAGMVGIDEWIPVADIKVDMQYQRPLVMGHVRKIAKEFDNKALGVLLVSERADGSHWVIDGQHRLAALRLLGRVEDAVPCHVYRNISVSDEALIFHMQTQRRQISPVDRFKARLFAGEETAITIDRIISRHGLQVQGYSAKGNLAAIVQVERIHAAHGEDRLNEVLTIAMSVLDGSNAGPSAAILDGINAFISRYEHLMDRNRLTRCVRDAGVDKVQRNATAVSDLMRESQGKACGRVLLSLYNHKLQTRRLPDWDSIASSDLVSKTKKAALKREKQQSAA